VWEVRYSLCNRLKLLALELIEEERKDNRCRESEYYTCQTDSKSIAEDTNKVRICKKSLELIETNPRASEDTVCRIEFFECDDCAVHWLVAEYDVVHKYRYYEKVQCIVTSHIRFESVAEAELIYRLWDIN
jgi:hypothetical protein